jgi:hypothetical protein
MNESLKNTIADNVHRLMSHYGHIVGKERMTTDDLAQLCKKKGAEINQKTVWNVINPDKSGAVTTATIEAIAKVFDIEPYHLMIPNLPLDELTNKRIEKVIQCYADSNSAGRENIARIAENEVRYRDNKIAS